MLREGTSLSNVEKMKKVVKEGILLGNGITMKRCEKVPAERKKRAVRRR
jgi:hypothetical protein